MFSNHMFFGFLEPSQLNEKYTNPATWHSWLVGPSYGANEKCMMQNTQIKLALSSVIKGAV